MYPRSLVHLSPIASAAQYQNQKTSQHKKKYSQEAQNHLMNKCGEKKHKVKNKFLKIQSQMKIKSNHGKNMELCFCF